MQFQPKKMLALLLAGLMLLPTMACAKGGDGTETKDPNATDAVTEEDTGYKPDIEKKNYNTEFNVIGTHTIMRWITPAEDSKGDAFEDTLHERALRLKEQLGVELVKIQSSDYEYTTEVIKNVQAGDATYQMVAAHCHIGVANLMSSGAMYDISKLESVNLEAPYWSLDFMEGLTINDEYVIGYNDFCLAHASCIVFNKDLMAEFNLKAPYDDVNNNTWTMEKMRTLASTVSKDNGDNVWDDKDVYGISGWGWTDLISLAVGSDVRMVDKDEDGEYVVAYERNSEKTLNVLTKINDIYQGVYAYFSTPGTSRGGADLDFGSGQSLIYLTMTADLPSLRGESVRFGILPNPKFDEAQANYRSFSWNGVLMIPSVFENEDPSMVSDTTEMLAYYTAPVKTAFYEDLLGTKLAESPEDAAMLNVVWDTQVTDVAMVTSDINGMNNILYMVPLLCRDGVATYSSFLKSNCKSANRALDNLFHPRSKN